MYPRIHLSIHFRKVVIETRFCQTPQFAAHTGHSEETIIAQWEFLTETCFNNDLGEVDWKMKSRRRGAYAYSYRQLQEAEDEYMKVLYLLDSQLQNSQNRPNSTISNGANYVQGLFG